VYARELAPVRQHHFEAGFLHRLVRACGRATKPALDLLNTDRVFRTRLADLDVEHCRWPDAFQPGVLAEEGDGEAGRFVEALGID
jgi:hypothetical protein